MARNRLPRGIKRTFGDWVFDIANTALMIGLFIIMLYPFWYCIILSFNDPVDYYKGPLYLWPRVFSLENYKYVFQGKNFGHATFISIARTVCGTVLHCIVTGAAAYGLSKRQLMFRNIYTKIFVFTMFFGGGMIPTYLLIRSLGMLDTFWVYIIPGAFGFYNAILFMAFYDSIPESLEESARIDGASLPTIFFKIIFPVSKPIFATIALYQIVGHWNSWMDTLLYTKGDHLMTLQAILMRLLKIADNIVEMLKTLASVGNQQADLVDRITPVSIRVAAMVVTTFPIVVVYPFFQKYFVKGIMLGSVKE